MGLIKKPNELSVKKNIVSFDLRATRYGKNYFGTIGTASAIARL